jgi:uncharacterized membrane protein
VRATERTHPSSYLTHFGLFVAVGSTFVAWRLIEVLRPRSRHGERPRWVRPGAVAGSAALVAAIAFAAQRGFGVAAISAVAIAVLAGLIVLEVRGPDLDVGRVVATALLLLAVGIGAGVDLVTVGQDIERMNTAFKFLFQAWQFYALASGYALWYVVRAAHQRAAARSTSWLRLIRPAWTVVLAGVLLAGLIFPIAGTRARLADRFAVLRPGLDGLAYLRADPTVPDSQGAGVRLREDEPLVHWLRDRVRGTPTIVEAPGPLYSWTSRISVMTGLPTVIGWDWHQKQQRRGAEAKIEERVADAERFFRDADPGDAARFLLRYDVAYVVVGTLERARGTAIGLAKLAAMPALHEVFRSGNNVLYAVDKRRLARDEYLPASPLAQGLGAARPAS